MVLGNPFYLRCWVGFHAEVWKDVSMVGKSLGATDMKVQEISAFMTICYVERDIYLCEY